MDGHRFDALIRSLGTSGTRRSLGRLLGLLLGMLPLTRPGFLAWLAALPLGGPAVTFFGEGADAAGRHKRRKKRHKHGRSRTHGKRKKTQCKSKSRAKICAGECGIVKSKQTCKKKVNCGSCACAPPCPVCQTCDDGGQCAPDAAQVGDECGDPGQVCQADGACACEASTCGGTTPFCVEGTCVACSADQPCPDGCCAGDGSCQPGTTAEFCGMVGGICQTCRAGQHCVDGACMLCLVGSCEPGNTSGCQYAALQEAVNDTVGPTTLQLCAGTYHESPIHIPRSLTLLGAGADQTTLHGQGTERVLEIAGEVAATVQDLTITGGRATDDGGGINNSGDLVLRHVTVMGNSTTREGGGISNSGSLRLEDGARIVGNAASLGGGIYNAFGGRVIMAAGSLVGGDTPADANTATDGGGIFSESDSTTSLENGSQVAGNTATHEGGGIFFFGTVTVQEGAAFVCDNEPSSSQCVNLGTLNGNCPNPPDGVCL